MMSQVVKASTRLLFPLLLVYGIYVILNGHLTPGGGFQGGVIVGTAFMLFALASGHSKISSLYNEAKLSLGESVGSISYLLIGASGIALGGAFLFNWMPKGGLGELLSAGFMLPLNIAIGLKVAAGVFTIVLMMLALNWEEDRID